MTAEMVIPLVLSLDKKERNKILKVLNQEPEDDNGLTDAQAKKYLIKYFKK